MKKKTKKFDPFENLVLDEYEQEIEDAIERGDYVESNDENLHEMVMQAAKDFVELEESKKITVRIKKKDLVKLKAKADRNNIPYQTLINLLITNYNAGKTKINL